MADQATTHDVTRALVQAGRVITLGGGAVIAHGHSRNTYDADIWLEPLADADAWSRLVLGALSAFPSATVLRIAVWQPIPPRDLP